MSDTVHLCLIYWLLLININKAQLIRITISKSICLALLCRHWNVWFVSYDSGVPKRQHRQWLLLVSMSVYWCFGGISSGGEISKTRFTAWLAQVINQSDLGVQQSSCKMAPNWSWRCHWHSSECSYTLQNQSNYCCILVLMIRLVPFPRGNLYRTGLDTDKTSQWL